MPGGTIDELGQPAVEQAPSPSAPPSAPLSSPPLSNDDVGERFSRQELGDVVVLPESFSYRLKKALLGPPLVTERLSVERLSKPMALGVLSPDCISSTAYGTEEILFVLVRAVGVAAFSLLLPITLAVIVVLLFVTLSYREVVMVYTRAGGSYVVARENFGVKVAQIAAVALIIDYVVTVAVQVAAGTDAVSSAFPALAAWDVEISVVVVAIMCYGNLRGIREAGRVFALPTYLFVTATGSLIIIGLIRAALGQLHAHPIPFHDKIVPFGHPGSGLLYGASVIIVLRAFANGGSSLTGLEAISNGVSNFRPPEGPNARRVLVIMAVILGSLVSGVSLLAHITHAVPYLNGSPTVLSQEAQYVFGSSPIGRFGFYFVQGATMLILWTGGNTSFNGFPNLASFVAEDSFLPRRLTRRGHRLVFSNGIILLAIAAEALLIATRAQLDILVGVYAVGVFTGFSFAGFGMSKHHLRLREKGWKHKLAINGFAGILSLSVVLIFVIVKFREGVWIVVLLFFILVPTLIRLHKEYEEERKELEENVSNAAVAPILRRHVVLVFVDRLDLADARALQYARMLDPDELRAVHFVLDSARAAELEAQWAELGLSRFPLDLVECPDRRLIRASMELVAEVAADGQTEVSVLLPHRVVPGAWQRLLHDRTSDRIAAFVGELPNVNATIVPFQLGKRRRQLVPWKAGGERGTGALHDAEFGTIGPSRAAREAGAKTAAERVAGFQTASPSGLAAGAVPIADLRPRQRARVAGRIRTVRVQPRAGVSSLECTIADGTGQVMAVFQGRRRVAGIEPGARVVVEGMVAARGRGVGMVNPLYWVISTPDHAEAPSTGGHDAVPGGPGRA
ncbi:MAG: amino acid permease [Acidimicrobiales bacterium]